MFYFVKIKKSILNNKITQLININLQTGSYVLFTYFVSQHIAHIKKKNMFKFKYMCNTGKYI